MKKIILITFFMFVSFAHASNWVLVTESVSGESFFVDKQSIVYSGNEVSYWQKVNYTTRSKKGDLSSKENWSVNCRTRESNLTYLITYSDVNNNGTMTDSFKVPTDWRPVSPDSVSSTILKFVCKR